MGEMKERIVSAVKQIISIEGVPFFISHGIFLSLMLALCLGKDTVEFWNNLEFSAY